MHLKIFKAAILFSAIAYLAIAPSPFKIATVTKQEAFEEWRQEFERYASLAPSVFKQSVSVYGQAGAKVYAFKFNPTEHSWDLLFRILDLIGSSKVFSRHDNLSGTENAISLRVEGFGEEFTARIPLEEGAQDSKLQILFKLLESKGQNVPAETVALSSKEKEHDESQPN